MAYEPSRPHRGPTLRLVVGGHAVEGAPLRPGDRWHVGSSPKADLVVRDSAVLPHHCTLHHRGEAVELSAVKSAGVVRVGEARIRAAEFTHEGQFQIGSTTISLSKSQPPHQALPGMVGVSRSMSTLADLVRKVATTTLPVLLRGETGTGKELVASALHQLSSRWDKPFVVVNSATISGDLGTSQLFGHVPGAFTGAQSARAGAFREAHEGTLFLDEIGSLPADAQAKLLRVLEDGKVQPVGSDRPVSVDVRIVAATCEPLERRVREGGFRSDLYERLSACLVEVPPLRERRADIPHLARAMLARSELASWTIEPEALSLLGEAPLPGNIRELRNVLIHAALRCEGRRIGTQDILDALVARADPTAKSLVPLDASALLSLLDSAGGNVSKAARRARVPRSTFRDLLRKHAPTATAPSPRRC